MPDIYDRVVEEISKLGTTNREIADKLGVSPECVRFWTNGYSIPKTENLARFHAAGLDIFYIITGKHIGEIVCKGCHNCVHFNECDIFDCDQDCDACSRNACRNCANQSDWLWEGFANAKK